jgi:hypothetical protein
MALIPLYLRNPLALFAFNQSLHLLHFVLILAFLAAIVLGFALIRYAFTQPRHKVFSASASDNGSFWRRTGVFPGGAVSLFEFL